MRVNRNELAEILGVSLPTINNKVRAGMPYIQKGARGKEWIFETEDVLAWEKEQAVQNVIGDADLADQDELKRRKLAAETTVAELEAAQAKREAVLVEDVVRIVTADYMRIRQALLQIPARVAPVVIGMDDVKEIKGYLDNEVRHVLEQLANDFDRGGRESYAADEVEEEPLKAASTA